MSLIRNLLNRFTRKNDRKQLKELKETLPETPAPKLQIRTVQDVAAATRIKTFQDIRVFCNEVRKTLTIYKKSCEEMRDASWVHKKAIDSLYVEWGNIADKIETLIESQKRGEE